MRSLPHTESARSSISPPGPQPLALLSGPVKRSTDAPLAAEDQSRTSVKSTFDGRPVATVTSSARASRCPARRAIISG